MSIDDSIAIPPAPQIAPPPFRCRVKRTCLSCRVEYETFASQRLKFCSIACRADHQKSVGGYGRRPRNGKTLACDRCGKEFYAAPAEAERRRYCSRECKELGQANSVRRNCVRCGKEFVRCKSVGGKYCRIACYHAATAVRKTCKACGKPLRKNLRTYCSHECHHVDRLSGEERPCESCGKPMYVSPYQTSKRFCSEACHHESKRIKGPGSKYKRQDGYVAVYYPTHPDATKGGVILEHRLVAEEKYGRRILRSEHVHHIDGDRANNRPENLEIVAPGDHARISNQAGVDKRQKMKSRLEELEAIKAEYERRFGPIADVPES